MKRKLKVNSDVGITFSQLPLENVVPLMLVNFETIRLLLNCCQRTRRIIVRYLNNNLVSRKIVIQMLRHSLCMSTDTVPLYLRALSVCEENYIIMLEEAIRYRPELFRKILRLFKHNIKDVHAVKLHSRALDYNEDDIARDIHFVFLS